jgi:hypothetical protein
MDGVDVLGIVFDRSDARNDLGDNYCRAIRLLQVNVVDTERAADDELLWRVRRLLLFPGEGISELMDRILK